MKLNHHHRDHDDHDDVHIW